MALVALVVFVGCGGQMEGSHQHPMRMYSYDAFVVAGIAGMRATQVTHRWQSTLTELSNNRAEQNRLLSKVRHTQLRRTFAQCLGALC